MTTTVQAPPTPLLFFQTATMYQRSAALKAGVELGLFTTIGNRAATAEQIARGLNVPERGVRILCDGLTVAGFLIKEGDTYRLTPDSAMFLDKHSPAYIGSAIDFINSPYHVEPYWHLADTIRNGGRAEAESAMTPDHPVWGVFARAMMPLMGGLARQVADMVEVTPGRPLRILDIAAGHGIYGITFAQRYPQADVTAVDWPAVLDVAKENAERFGVADRYRTIPGSAFDVDLGTGYDLVLLTNFLHHFDPTTDEVLLRKVHGALAEGGRALTLEFVPNDDRVSPPEAASFALTMLAMTESGNAYTFRELEGMFRSAGFSRSEARPLQPPVETLIVSHW